MVPRTQAPPGPSDGYDLPRQYDPWAIPPAGSKPKRPIPLPVKALGQASYLAAGAMHIFAVLFAWLAWMTLEDRRKVELFNSPEELAKLQAHVPPLVRSIDYVTFLEIAAAYLFIMAMAHILLGFGLLNGRTYAPRLGLVIAIVGTAFALLTYVGPISIEIAAAYAAVSAAIFIYLARTSARDWFVT